VKLREHQIDGASFLLANPKAYLAHRPGLGKTRTLIYAAQLAGIERPLIVTPAIVRSHWHRELDVMQFVDDLRSVGFVASYDEVLRGGVDLLRTHIKDNRIDALILDEAHLLKHATAKRTRILLGKDGYARRLPVVWAASGTPLPRNPAEIWTLLSSVFPWVPLQYGVKAYKQFVERYCITRPVQVRGQWRDKIVGNNPEHLAELNAMLAQIMQVREPGDDMPAIDWQVLRLDVPEHDQYAFVEIPTALSLQSAIRHGTLEDIANDPHVSRMRRRLGELKVAPVVELLKAQLENSDEKIAVFAHHRSVLLGLRDGLAEFGVAYIDGDSSTEHREEALEAFQHGWRERPRVFIGQNIACKEGMDGLQHATNRAILVEPDWSASVNDQLGHRVARMGSTHDYAIVQMVALAGTLDEAIVAQNKRETEMVAQAMPGGSLI
jgi:SWI/SNF-related matrix-associated actin-dependent regulator 1 of chromatin subfamily A